jgi:hypothetical protein
MKSHTFFNRTLLTYFCRPILFTLVGLLFFASCKTDKDSDQALPGKEEIQTLELNFKDMNNGEEFDLSMVPRHGGVGPWEFFNMQPHPWLPIPLERRYFISDADINKLDIQDDGKGNFTLTDSDGNPTEWSGTYTVENGPAANEITYKGTLTDGVNNFEFVGITDPAPLVVIAVAGIGAAICALVIALDDCENSNAIEQSIEACRENGGKPQLTITTTFGLSVNPFRMGCGTDCKFECL